MPDHKGKFAPTYEGLYVAKRAFSRGALILAAWLGMTSICPPILMPSYGTLHKGASQCTLFLHFCIKKKCKKVDQKTERAVCAKREPKEREREKI